MSDSIGAPPPSDLRPTDAIRPARPADREKPDDQPTKSDDKSDPGDPAHGFEAYVDPLPTDDAPMLSIAYIKSHILGLEDDPHVDAVIPPSSHAAQLAAYMRVQGYVHAPPPVTDDTAPPRPNSFDETARRMTQQVLLLEQAGVSAIPFDGTENLAEAIDRAVHSLPPA